MDQHDVVRRRQEDRLGRPDRPALRPRGQSQRYAGPGSQPGSPGRVRPPRRRRRQCAGEPGAADARGPGDVSPRLRLPRAARRGALVGIALRRLAPPLRLPEPAQRLPAMEDVRQVDFTTMSPGVSSRMAWATIEAQVKCLAPSSVHLALDPRSRPDLGNDRERGAAGSRPDAGSSSGSRPRSTWSWTGRSSRDRPRARIRRSG